MSNTATKAPSTNLLDESNLLSTTAPHIKSKYNTQTIMRDVLIALIPTSLFGIYFFGIRALLVILVGVISAVLSEYIFQKFTGKKITIFDLSAAITGLLIALNLPSTIPLWMVSIGSIFAVILIKQCFGGIGCNFMNPALGARVFLMACWAGPVSAYEIDGIATATPLTVLKMGGGELASLSDVFIGRIPGSIGEVSALAILIGAAYLLYKKVISWHIPVVYVGTVILLTTIIGRGNGLMSGNGIYEALSGGLMLGAFFMATDYSTRPMTKKGQIILALGCGIMTTLIRIFGGYSEGVALGIILMNLFVPIIDNFTMPKKFGS